MITPISFVSLGPGDPELITLQSLRCLQTSERIYTPVAVSPKGKHGSKARDILLSHGIGEEHICLYELPMVRGHEEADRAYRLVAEEIARQKLYAPEVAISVVAEGDSGFYASSAYIATYLEELGIPHRQLCGVPAIIACNALLGGQLAQLEEQLHVVPGETSLEQWQTLLSSTDTVVIMKCALSESVLKDLIVAYPERRWHYFEFVGMDREYTTSRVDEILERKFPYFSIIISKMR